MRPESGNGSGRSRIELTRLNTVVFAPIHKASVKVAVDQRIGSRRSARTAWRKLSIIFPPGGDRAAESYLLSRTECLFRTVISLDAASGIFAPLPKICLLVQRWPYRAWFSSR